MIATVRIAPVERWCDMAKEFLKVNPGFVKLVGLPVGIITESVRANESGCDSPRQWQVPNEIAERHFAIAGITFIPGQTSWICEHMLEMD